jgi:hypothetical protein
MELVGGDAAEQERLMVDQLALWESVSRYVGELDPFARIRTVHPTPGLRWSSSGSFAERDSFDLDMLQTGHSGFASVVDSMVHVRESLAHGDKPVVNGECSYEGIGASCWADVQRFLFWSHMLSGTAGHTYGTMPISTFSSRDDHYRAPSRAHSADWEDAIAWDGAVHVGIGRRILERYRWWELTPAPDAIELHAGPDDWFRPYAATLPDGSVLVYLPGMGQMSPATPTLDYITTRRSLVGLAPGAYRATFVDLRTGLEEPSVRFETSDGRQALGDLTEPAVRWDLPTWEDWLLVVRPAGSVASVSSKPW